MNFNLYFKNKLNDIEKYLIYIKYKRKKWV